MHTPLVLGSLIFLSLIIAAILFMPGDLSGKIDECEKKGDREQQCFAELILKEATASGVSRGFDLLEKLHAKNKKFAAYCHANVHELGALAYLDFEQGKDIPLSTLERASYCGFGFYHGFLEALLAENGNLSAARIFCEEVDAKLRDSVSGISFACYHGIGHGVVDGSDPSRWGDADAYIAPGLGLCDTLGKIEEQKERCASGVFNALAISYRNPSYRLDPSPDDPYAVCRRQEKRYAHEACYDQMNGYVVGTTATFAEALLRAVKSSEPDYAPVAVKSIAGFIAQRALSGVQPLSHYLDDCGTLPDFLGGVCAQGFATGLVEFGKPGKEYAPAIAACAESEHARSCLRGLSLSVEDRFGPAAQRKLCADIDRIAGEERGEECRQITAQ